MPLDGRNGAAGLVWAVERVESPLAPDRVKKQLCVGAARCLPSGFRSEVSAWLECYDRVLLGPARCAHLPPRARESVQPGRGGRAKSPHNTPVAGSDDAEARRAASRRCRGFAQSCRRRWVSDQGRSDPCSRHQQGGCGRVSCVSVRDPLLSSTWQQAERVCLNAASPTSDFCLSTVESESDRIAVLTDYIPFESGRRSFCP